MSESFDETTNLDISHPINVDSSRKFVNLEDSKEEIREVYEFNYENSIKKEVEESMALLRQKSEQMDETTFSRANALGET